jgi:hypothetical protein
MWVCNRGAFTRIYGVTDAQATLLQATAEHLIARRDGGGDTDENVVAACLFCNRRRHHARRLAPAPIEYLRRVRARVAAGKWHGMRLV